MITEEAANMREHDETEISNIENISSKLAAQLRSVLTKDQIGRLVRVVISTHENYIQDAQSKHIRGLALNEHVLKYKQIVDRELRNGPVELRNDQERRFVGERIIRAIDQIYRQPGLKFDTPLASFARAPSVSQAVLDRMHNSLVLKIQERLMRTLGSTTSKARIESLTEVATPLALENTVKSLDSRGPTLNPRQEMVRDAAIIQETLKNLDFEMAESKAIAKKAESLSDKAYEPRSPRIWTLPLNRIMRHMVPLIEEMASGAGSQSARESTAADLYASLKKSKVSGEPPTLQSLIQWALTTEAENLSESEFASQMRQRVIPMLTAENRRDRDGNLAALENFRSHLPAEQIILFDRVRGPLVQRIRSRVDQQIKNIPDKEKKSQARDKKTNELLELSHTSLQEAFAQEYLQPLAKNREEFEARIDRVLNLTSRGITELETVDKTPAAIEVEPPQEIISRTKIPKPVAAPVAKIVSVPSELVSPVIESPVEKTANEQPQTLDQIVLEELSLRTPVAHKKNIKSKAGRF
jgi:hypothetical protein